MVHENCLPPLHATPPQHKTGPLIKRVERAGDLGRPQLDTPIDGGGQEEVGEVHRSVGRVHVNAGHQAAVAAVKLVQPGAVSVAAP